MFVRATLIYHADYVEKFKGTNNNGLRDLHERRGERGGKENERGQKDKWKARLSERDLRGKTIREKQIKTEESVKEKDRRPGF